MKVVRSSRHFFQYSELEIDESQAGKMTEGVSNRPIRKFNKRILCIKKSGTAGYTRLFFKLVKERLFLAFRREKWILKTRLSS